MNKLGAEIINGVVVLGEEMHLKLRNLTSNGLNNFVDFDHNITRKVLFNPAV